MARPKGQPKLGGRVKGTPNKVTAAKIAALEASGLMPLDFMLDALRNEQNSFEVRYNAAKDAAPYCHNRLTAIDGRVKVDITDDMKRLIQEARGRI